MYTPLKYMEQLEEMIIIPNAPEMCEWVNKETIQFFKELIEEDRDSLLYKWGVSWNRLACGYPVNSKIKAQYDAIAIPYRRRIPIEMQEPEDLLHQSLMMVLYHDWTRNKRVYKIEETMMNDFINMKVSTKISMDTIAKLPSKCFYIDYGKYQGFCERSPGCFLMLGEHKGAKILYAAHLIEGDRIMVMGTVLQVPEDGLFVHYEEANFKGAYSVIMEDGSRVIFKERDFVHFLFNFLTYMQASNNDIEYTERTKQVYKPSKTPKNRIKEVEEFGVGFRYSTPVTTKPKVKYVKSEEQLEDADTPEEVQAAKRAYSSNIRSAHWHHYWINDPEKPGEKKLIVHWLPENFIKGNKAGDNAVRIHKVK